MGFLLGDALVAIIHIQLDVGIWEMGENRLLGWILIKEVCVCAQKVQYTYCQTGQ